MVGPEHKVEQREIIDLETSSVGDTEVYLKEGGGYNLSGRKNRGSLVSKGKQFTYKYFRVELKEN